MTSSKISAAFSQWAVGGVESERRPEGGDLGGGEHAADQVLALVGGQAVDLDVAVAEAVPDGEQESGDEPEAGLPVGRGGGGLRVPEGAPARLGRVAPARRAQGAGRERLAVEGTQQAHAALDGAVLEDAHRRLDAHGGPLRLLVDHQLGGPSGGALGVADAEGLAAGERPDAVAAADFDDLGVGAGLLVDDRGLAACDLEVVGLDALDALVEGAGVDGVLDVGFETRLEGLEQLVLFVDGQREQAVEERVHGGQLLAQRAFAVGQAQAGGVLEAVDGPVGDAAAVEAEVELAQRGRGVGRLEVVGGAEQRGVAVAHRGLRVALAAGDGAEAVEAAGDGGDEAALALDVGGHGPEQRRGLLVGAVGAAEALNGLVGAPAGFEQVVDAAVGVGAAEVGVVAAAGVAGHREDEDLLVAVHEGARLARVGRGGAGPQGVALAVLVAEPEDAPGAAGDLGDGLVAEVVEDLVQGRADRVEQAEALDQLVAQRDGLLRLHGVAVLVEDRARVRVAVVVGVLLVQHGREGVHQEVQDVLARGQVDGQVVPLGGGDLGEAALGERLAGRDELDDGRASGFEVGFDGAQQRRALHRGEEVSEEALLGALEGAHRGGLGLRVVGRAAARDPGGLEGLLDVGVDDLERAGVGVVGLALGGRDGVLEDVDLDAGVTEGAGLVEAEGLQVAGDDLEGGHAAGVHGLDELVAVLERRAVGGPEAEPARVGEALDGARAGSRHVENAGVGQGVLEADAGAPLLARGDGAAVAASAGGVGHRVGLVEDDDAVEGVAFGLGVAAGEPVDDLVEPRPVAVAGGRAQGGVGGEEDPLALGYRILLAEAAEGDEVVGLAAYGDPVAARVLDELVGLGEPEGAAAALQPAVEDDGGDLAALAAAGAVAEHPALPELHGAAEARLVAVAGVGFDLAFRAADAAGEVMVGAHAEPGRQLLLVGLGGEDDAFELCVREGAAPDEPDGQ